MTPEEQQQKDLEDLLAKVILESEDKSNQPSPLRERAFDLTKDSYAPFESNTSTLSLPEVVVPEPPPQPPLHEPTPAPPAVDLTQDVNIDEARQLRNMGGDAPPEDLTKNHLADNLAESVMLAPLAAYKFTEPYRQATSGMLGTIGSFPWEAAAQVASIPTLINRMFGDNTSDMEAQVKYLQSQGAGAKEALRKGVMAKADPTGGDYLAHVLGESVLPVGKATLPLTLTNAALREGTNWLMSDGVPVPAKMDLTTDVPNPFVSPAQAAPAGAPAPGKIMDLSQFNPSAQRIIQTVGGPKQTSNSELATLGILGVSTLGFMFGPGIYRALKTNTLPPLHPTERQIRDAPQGTVAISSPIDLARAYDDINAPAIRIAEKAGVNIDVVENLENTFRIQTRGAAQSLADSAVVVGEFHTPTFNFRTSQSLQDQAATSTPQLQQYLHALDTFDDLNIRSQQQRFAQSQNPTAAQPGPPVVRGYDMPAILQEIGALERAYPEVRQQAQLFQEHIKAVRDFESTGEYATREKNNPNWNNPARVDRSEQWMNSQRPFEVPFAGERDYGVPNTERGNPFATRAQTDRIAIRRRMENEAVGMYVDAMNQRNAPGIGHNSRGRLFTQVSNEELADNARYKQNTVSFYRRGKIEHWVTDPLLADTLRMDPYYMTSGIGQAFYATKRALEWGSTGAGNPGFALTNLVRSWWIGKFTSENLRSPTILGSMAAVPRQLYPQLGKWVSDRLNNGSAQWLSNVVGQTNMDALAQHMGMAWEQSLYRQLKTVGSAKGSIMEQQARSQALTRFGQAVDNISGPLGTLYKGYRNLLEAVHNAPAFDFASRNRGAIPLPELAMRARRLTGDPITEGSYRASSGKPIRFEPDTSRLTQTAVQAVKAYGITSDVLKPAIPWMNYTIQGMKRLGEAYLQNPMRFTQHAWLYAGMPAATGYLIARSLGNDPNGLNYVDYMLNRRSAYDRQMNFYIPIPGLPAERGFQIPRVHELAPMARMMEIALDHMFQSSIFSEKEDMQRAAWGFLETAIIPPMPPLVNAVLGTMGQVGPQGLFAGEVYKKKADPYDQTGGLPTSIELVVRALGGGIGDTVGSGYAAFVQTPEGAFNSVGNAASEVGKRLISKTPIVRDITGIKPPMSGNTDVTSMLFEKQKVIDSLIRHYEKYDKEDKQGNTGMINTNPASAKGGLIGNELLGKPLPNEPAGLNQPEPTNPLYRDFMEEVYARFKKENPGMTGQKFNKAGGMTNPGTDEGGIGFRSLWRRYGDATEHLRRLKNINDGNNVTWQAQLEKRPQQLEELRSANVNPTKINEVRNYYEKKRQDAARVILFTIRAVETDIGKRLGRPFKIENLDPYGKGLEDAPFMFAGDVALVQRDAPPASGGAPSLVP